MAHTAALPVTSLAARTALSLKLSTTAINPGQQVTATGFGCDPAAAVTLMVDQSPIGATRADAHGAFELPLTVSPSTAGRHDVTADCGQTTTAAMNVVLVSRVGAGAATTTLIVIFLVSGVWYFGRRIMSPNELRNPNA